MLSSKQRAALTSLAGKTETLFQMGKSGLTENLIKQVEQALTARELIKIGVTRTSPLPAKDAAARLAGRTNAEVVHVIGSKIVLYRANPEKPDVSLRIQMKG
jgi:RNA-binding protein